MRILCALVELKYHVEPKPFFEISRHMLRYNSTRVSKSPLPNPLRMARYSSQCFNVGSRKMVPHEGTDLQTF